MTTLPRFPIPAISENRQGDASLPGIHLDRANDGRAYVATWCEWRDGYAQPTAVARSERDRAEERSLASAMAGLCLGWFVAGPAGGLCGLLVGAWFGAR